MASWVERRDEPEHERKAALCLACGIPLDEPFSRLGSLRCLECRAADRRLDPELVDQWQANGGHLH